MASYGKAVADKAAQRATPYSKASGDKLPEDGRQVYVSNLPWQAKWQDLKDHMAKAGEVEFARILTMDGTDWSPSRGVAYVRYAAEEAASQAIMMLNGTEYHGRRIVVDPWTGPKPVFSLGKGAPMGMGFFYGGGKGYGRTKIHGEPNEMVYVGNLPYKVGWKELKEHMSKVGTVQFVKMLTEDGSEWGRKKGVAIVRFSSPDECKRAVTELNNTELEGRNIIVDVWTSKE